MKLTRKTLICALTIVLVFALASPVFAEDAKALYGTKCAACHGADGSKANPAMGVRPLKSPEVQKQTDAELTAAITNGKGKMPAYKGKIADADIEGLVKYIRTLK